MKNIKFIVIAGSSGGHILPAIKYCNIISKIKEPNEILFISNEIGKNYIERINDNRVRVLTFSTKNKFAYILKIFFNLISLFFFNRKITLLGFGGFITTPILIFSKFFNIFFFASNRIYIHEQNIIYGLANKINYLIAKNVFISFPKNKMRSKEIFVGNFFLDREKAKEKLDNNFINILLMGGSAGSIDLNKKMLKEIMNLNRKHLNKLKFFVQIPNSNLEIIKKKYISLVDANRLFFFSFKNDLNIKEYDFIISRSGSGSINEILYYTNNVYFIPHLISRDQHQKFNLNYFLSHEMSLRKFLIPYKKNRINQFYFNSLINPHSIEKIICYTTR